MTDVKPFESLVTDIEADTRYSTEKRLGQTWGNLARMHWKNPEMLKRLPVRARFNSPDPFTPEKPITIPLLGGGRLEIGRYQRCHVYQGQQEVVEGDVVIGIHTPSHRSKDQEEGKQVECEVTLTDAGSIYGANIDLLHKEGRYPTREEHNLLHEARRFMALFDPEKDIVWSELTQPTEQQSFLLQQAGWHPPPPAPPTT